MEFYTLVASYMIVVSILPGSSLSGLWREVRHPGATAKVMQCFREILQLPEKSS